MASGHIADVIGSYRKTLRTGLITGIGAGGALAVARWTDTVQAMRLRAIEVERLITTGYTAAQELAFDVVIGRGWSVAPTGGTSVVLTGNEAKKRTAYQTSKIAAGDMRVSTTGALTNGTVTLDTDPIASGGGWAVAATAGALIGPRRFEFFRDEKAEEPYIFLANEGVLVRNVIAQGAAGVERAIITIEWDEVILYR